MPPKKTKKAAPDPRFDPQYTIPLRLVAKLGSIAVHVDEFLAAGGHEFDLGALKELLRDPEVVAWIQEMGPLLPRKR